ncbi:ATP-binding protein [Candidatus Nomurabacteria bacterium]|nr:ATP-binding protein [Candidatus Nomurabacteria bacterium]
MDSQIRNQLFFEGKIDIPGLFPKLDELNESSVIFNFDFGLKILPEEPGILAIRGARQFGKSTWLETMLKQTIERFGPQSAFYLNGDDIKRESNLYEEILRILSLFKKESRIKRIFIDEITAVDFWEKSLKRLYDQGEIRDVLIITTGSQVIDLRKATERLPGRKGKLNRTSYRFLPVCFDEFCKKLSNKVKRDLILPLYCFSGGSPLAINAILAHGYLPDYVTDLTKDWVYGELTQQGKSPSSLKFVIDALFRHATLPTGLRVIAEKAGLSNNTLAQSYCDFLKDLGCLSTVYPIDGNKWRPIPKKAAKYHFINLLFATSFHPKKPRTMDEILTVFTGEKGCFFEWLVAQELWRRSSIANEDFPEDQYYWRSNEHEIDFVENLLSEEPKLIEVKSGQNFPSDFDWVRKTFPHKTLYIVGSKAFQTQNLEAVKIETFLKREAF